MTHSPLRERIAGHHARVTPLELFFDLVFVFAITQISHGLLAHLTWAGAAQTVFLLLAVWWAWIYTAWVTNWLDPEHRAVRVMLLVLMAIGLILSTSLSDAFGKRALYFAVAYVTFQVGRSLFMIWVGKDDPVIRINFQRIAAWLAFSGVFWISGALAGPVMRPAIWSVALAIEIISPSVGFWAPGLGRTETRDWTVEGAHLAERCGLFIMICLGESILVTGATFSGLAWTPAVVAAFASAFLGSIAMWWIYFSSHADAAAETIAESRDPGAIARVAYTYLHIPMVAGVVVAAAGDELVLAHPSGHLEPVTALVLIGGPALYLAGAVAFKFSIFRVVSPSRTTGLVATLLLIPAAPHLTPLILASLATLILIGVASWEALLLHRRGPPSAAQAA